MPSAPPRSTRPEATTRATGRWILGAGALGVALVVAALLLQSAERSAELTLDPADIRPVDGYAFHVDLKRSLPWPWQPLSDHLFNPYRSSLRLFEDGRPLGPPHTEFDRIRSEGVGYMHWRRVLIFATSDRSDPTTNGRVYRVELRAGVAYSLLRQLADIGGLLILAALAAALWVGRARVARAGAAGARHLARRAPDYLLGALAPTAASLAAFQFLPPLWNGSDSSIWLLWQLSWIPHHPPLYPALMALIKALWGEAPRILVATQWIQHLAHILAIAYLASAYRVKWQILLVSTLACVGAELNLFAHGLFTEGLATPLTLLFLGALLRLHRDGLTKGVALALALSLLAASLSRHALLVLGALPVAYVLITAVLSLGKSTRPIAVPQTILLVLAVALVNSGLTRYVTFLLDAQQVSALGRPGVYRIQEAYALLPASERDAWLDSIGARTEDPAVRAALPLMARTPNPWTGPSGAILADPGFWGHHPDEILNEGFKTFVSTPDPVILRQWRNELVRAILGTGSAGYCPGQVSCLFQGSAQSLESVFPAEPRYAYAVVGTGAEHPESAAEYRALAVHPLTRFLDLLLPLTPLHRLLFLIGSFGLAVWAVVRVRELRFGALAATLWIGAAVYALALTFVTVVLPRYLSPIDLLIWLANAASLVALAARPRGPAGVADARARPSV